MRYDAQSCAFFKRTASSSCWVITEKVAQYVAYVDCDGSHDSAHDTARDAERLLIRLIGLDNLLNSRHGGAGRVPKDTRIGGVFIIVCV